MAGTLSKRQQARNEAVLHDLVHSVPGNNICADCHARNPAWASWSLGVFLCMRCAAIHRKLGTHISKVKSLSMDAWTNEQVDNMRKVGNLTSNKIYNAENKKPPIPIDADEVDSAMERFIRQKYIENAGGQSSKKKPFLDEGTPPPLPPKNSKFGFRSASSIFPLSSKSKKEARQSSLEAPNGGGGASLGLTNKQSKVFGATVDYGEDDMEKKMARLRDMGFLDEHRNAMILKGVNGSLERAVEALVRLGEGDRRTPSSGTASIDRTLRDVKSSGALGPTSTTFGGVLGTAARISPQERPTSALTPSTNPFDIAPLAPPQTAYSTGAIQNNNPYTNPANPFGVSMPQTDLNQTLQNLSLAPAQPLFPHHTGGVISQHSHQFPRYQSPNSSTPSFTRSYQGMGVDFNGGMAYQQPVSQPLVSQQTGFNPYFSQQQHQRQQPFLQQSQQQQQQQQQQASSFQPQNQQTMSINTAQAQPIYANNPFTRSPTRIASPPLMQIPEQSQPTMFQTPLPLQPQHANTNPFLNDMMRHPSQPDQRAFDQQQFWQPKRQDKATILALYNQAPPVLPAGAATHPVLPMALEHSITAAQGMQGPVPMQQQSRSISQPIPSSTNPFMKNGPVSIAPSEAFATDKKTSRESVNLGMDMAWTNGRHSPDAFASLSARHV